MNAEFPAKLKFLFRPARYKVAYGGRGSAKSWSVARALALMATERKLRILCTREIQKSIKDSVHKLLSDQIESLGLSRYFELQEKVLRCRSTGSEFIFAGLRNNVEQIKSTEGIDICWVEEAEKISENSWQVLIPTIRKDGSEIWITFNPDEETDPTSKRFMANPPPGSVVQPVNWQDNPWFPEVLRKEKDYDYSVDADAAAHVWGGQFRKASAAQIFRGKYIVESFEPQAEWNGPYFGADWGFSTDPTTLLKMWLFDRELFIEYEAYQVGCELNNLPKLFDEIPGAREHIIRADNSRPETISHVCKLGFLIIAAEKWPGSVEDGINWLRGLRRIVIHPRCTHTEREARLYKFKVDALTGDVLPIIVDKHNHCWDAIRYALQPIIMVPEREDVVVHEETVNIASDLDDFDLRSRF